jgi:hypothetical protein
MKRLILLSALAMIAIIPATAMATTTETLPATTTTTKDNGTCTPRTRNGQWIGLGVTFTGTGTATGTYSGSFMETGSASLSGNYGPFGEGYFSANFTINSTNGATKGDIVKGTITRRPLFGVFSCGGMQFNGPNGQDGTYTATVTAPNGSQQAINGTANIGSGLLPATPSPGSLSITLTLP